MDVLIKLLYSYSMEYSFITEILSAYKIDSDAGILSSSIQNQPCVYVLFRWEGFRFFLSVSSQVL